MSLDHCDYGWRTGVHGFEPVPTLDPMAPDELQAVIAREIVATGGAAARRIVCTALQHVETAKALHAEILSILM